MTETTCAAAILDLLTLYPDCEMRAADVWSELDERWEEALVRSTLEALVADGSVSRLNHDGEHWYSVAIRLLEATAWLDA